ncbi:amino acid ABC transporter substrate-binding protein [Sedimentitalea nanhaiensis]|uniref:Amino acid ABC transporter substrate-binding protein, PAAT family n=1 Tax=Sedimentitalea nanhaiensis TaxID=999627 RepID=A0A1I6XJF0_9RHOB|nr:amino acid ABC transporter substrate-binding protein [Sedimentitalea nanhaiensis]SFT38004.1 amino acid ABC transporter substrate-binding protein, PAAT family [Sedimentitalea nanhaiensis]
MRNPIYPLLAAALFALPASAQTLERIKETGEVHFGYRVDAAPLSYQNANGDPAGYAPLICVHIGQAIANSLQMTDLEASFVPVDASNRFDKVASGEIDLLCGASTITLTRRETVDFSDPIYVDGTAILQLQGASGSFPDLAGKKLGARDATTTLEALNTTLGETGMQADVVTFADHDAAIAALEAKDIDAYFADQSILASLIANSGKAETLQMSSEIMTIEKQGLALARGDADFRLLVDFALSELYASGRMRAIFDEAMPGAKPGAALQAMYLLAPTAR